MRNGLDLRSVNDRKLEDSYSSIEFSNFLLENVDLRESGFLFNNS